MTAHCPHGRPLGLNGRGQSCRHCWREHLADVASRPVPPPPEPPSLDAGRAARDQGITAATTSTSGKWDTAVVVQAIAALAASGRPFGADDVRHVLPAVAPQVIGSAFNIAARRGLIAEVGTRQSRNASRHAGLVRVWQGTRTARPAGTLDEPKYPHSAEIRGSTKSTGRLGLPRLQLVAAGHVTGAASETVEAKARRLLVSGRVQIRLIDPEGRVSAVVHGDTGTWHVHRSRHGHWVCSCEAAHYRRTCSHLLAVQLVTPEPVTARRTA